MVNRDFVYFKASNIQIQTEENVAWTIDGEYAGDLNFVDIKNCNKTIELAICESVEK